jgi:hypothetical protein
MNFRRLIASVSLDGGTYVRELEERCEDIATQLYKRGEQLASEKHHLDRLKVEHDALAHELTVIRSTSCLLVARVSELEAEVAYQTTRENEFESEASAHAREMIEMRGALNDANAQIDSLLRRLGEQLPLVDAPASPPPAPPEVVSDTVQRRVYQIVKLALEDGYKWYFTDGGSESFNAAILDEDFLGRMNRREILFAHGDALEVDVHIVSTRQDKAFKTTYEFVKVRRHLVPDQQPTFPFNSEAEASEGVVS